jgi:Protein of unknown function (DUF2892)
MKKNLGNADRMLRVAGACGAASCAVLAPYPLALRLGLFGGTAIYLLLTAFSGTCLGYRLMGKSTCPTGQRA